jgi:Flp pilus assembly protein TadG
MGRETFERKAFLRLLLHDRTANTIAIAAAAMIPLLAMVGGGVDASRYYMTASRMQAACDAGALAARRAMTDDTFTSEHRQIGLDFYDQNFSDGMFGVEGGTRDYTSDGEGVVTGTASGTLPTAIMGAFGYESFGLSVSCTAEINISNSDIMFVLDVTGSMADCPDNSACSSGPGSKIVALREAVMNFYDTVDAATSDSAQIRYGVVPYSQQVNVGLLIPDNMMATEHTYQSRVARFQEVQVLVPGNGVEVGDWITYSDQTEWLPRLTSNLGTTPEDNYRFNNRTGDPTRTNTADRDRCELYSGNTYNVGTDRWQVVTDDYVLNVWRSGSLNNRAGCSGRVIRQRQATSADVVPDTYRTEIQFRDWVYCPVDTTDGTPCNVSNPTGSPAGWETVDLATLYDDNRIALPLGAQGAFTTLTWEGCIEEPVRQDNGNYNPVPADAHDLNINLVPDTEAERWKPALRNAVWKREDGSTNTLSWLYQTTDESRPGWTCPRSATRLAEMPRADLQTYVNSLTASGNTYHDLGMLWGARFISPRGIFAADNETAPNGDAIARHIVFMTDGVQVNNNENYSTHGVEWWDRRISGDGSNTNEFNRRRDRLQVICRAARQENITVWVVAFGTALTQNLIDCASPGRAFQANDSETLDARFQEIAQKIAALRLTS